MTEDTPRALPPGAGLRFPAFLWAMLHAPLFLLLYASSLGPAFRGIPSGYRLPMWPAVAVEALVLALLVFAVPLPASLAGRPYRFLAPFFAGLATVLVAIDSRLYAAVGFHVNGFFFQVLKQPAALRETGIPQGEVVLLVLQCLGWILLETVLGAWFLRRLASRRRVWIAALAILALGVAERVYVASLTFFGGQAVFAAGQVLPLQAPVRMNAFWSQRTGRQALGNPLRSASRDSAVRLPPGVEPGAIRFQRKPDVLLLLMESARADYLSPEVMPRLWKRVQAQGTVFESHETSCPSTFFAVYGLLFGLHAHTFDAALGTGRRPLLFGALAANGYASRIFAASSVDWMGLRETVFGDVQEELESDWGPEVPGDVRDEAIIDHAKKAAQAAPPDRPLFLFLFFDGTHFNYFYPERSARFAPAWDGKGVFKATDAPPATILNRGRNAAYELDWKMDELLDWMEKTRGRRPLAIVTGDHGEEMREKGHLGHGSALVREQIQVPMVILGDGVPVGRHPGATVHDDVVPTLFHLLGDRTPPSLYGDGQDMFQAPDDRFVLVSMGWEPRYAAVSRTLKVAFNAMDAGLGGVSVTDPADQPLPDGQARFRSELPRIMQLFQSPTAKAAAAR
jgi:membrane-anchored protein YejM (alkaline phosphatase superfamily)